MPSNPSPEQLVQEIQERNAPALTLKFLKTDERSEKMPDELREQVTVFKTRLIYRYSLGASSQDLIALIPSSPSIVVQILDAVSQKMTRLLEESKTVTTILSQLVAAYKDSSNESRHKIGGVLFHFLEHIKAEDIPFLLQEPALYRTLVEKFTEGSPKPDIDTFWNALAEIKRAAKSRSSDEIRRNADDMAHKFLQTYSVFSADHLWGLWQDFPGVPKDNIAEKFEQCGIDDQVTLFEKIENWTVRQKWWVLLKEEELSATLTGRLLGALRNVQHPEASVMRQSLAARLLNDNTRNLGHLHQLLEQDRMCFSDDQLTQVVQELIAQKTATGADYTTAFRRLPGIFANTDTCKIALGLLAGKIAEDQTKYHKEAYVVVLNSNLIDMSAKEAVADRLIAFFANRSSPGGIDRDLAELINEKVPARQIKLAPPGAETLEEPTSAIAYYQKLLAPFMVE